MPKTNQSSNLESRIINEIREEHRRFLEVLREEWNSQLKSIHEGFQLITEKNRSQ